MSEISDQLEVLDRDYVPELALVREKIKTPGYHTLLPDGTVAHSTRTAMDYALLLLDSNNDGRLDRAAQVIRKIASLQETDPTKATYGIWSWFYDEPLEKMSPPDWNWADFIGGRIAQAIATHGHRLPGDVLAVAKTSLRNAAWSIFRRNIGPGYTNIAIMGAMVTAAAGEILGEPFLLDYGRRRIQNVVAALAEHGSFQEYNSPTYTMVVLEETDRLRLVVKDAPCRAAAVTLAEHAWQLIADSFHPSTGQWAGPHSRAYADRLRPGMIQTLEAATGLSLAVPRPGEPEHDGSEKRLTPPVEKCPAKFLERFRRLPQPEMQLVRRFIRRADHDIIGTTWLTERAALGSINRENTWTQRRFLIGYLHTPADPAVVFRVSARWNDIDFMALGVRQAQQGPRVLSAFHVLTGSGAYHLSLDRMPESIYATTDLRIRCELTGHGVRVKKLAEDRYELAADPFRVIVHLPAGQFDGAPITHELVETTDRAGVHAVLYHGPEKRFDFKKTAMTFAIATELLTAGQEPSAPPSVTVHGDQLATDWPAGALRLESPINPQPL
jgi:hypothetical protein